MDLKPVDSSHLIGIGYDPDTQTLRVRFRDGSEYDYEGVTPQQHIELATAKSHGKHFFANIKSVFDGRRVPT